MDSSGQLPQPHPSEESGHSQSVPWKQLWFARYKVPKSAFLFFIKKIFLRFFWPSFVTFSLGFLKAISLASVQIALISAPEVSSLALIKSTSVILLVWLWKMHFFDFLSGQGTRSSWEPIRWLFVILLLWEKNISNLKKNKIKGQCFGL